MEWGRWCGVCTQASVLVQFEAICWYITNQMRWQTIHGWQESNGSGHSCNSGKLHELKSIVALVTWHVEHLRKTNCLRMRRVARMQWEAKVKHPGSTCLLSSWWLDWRCMYVPQQCRYLESEHLHVHKVPAGNWTVGHLKNRYEQYLTKHLN